MNLQQLINKAKVYANSRNKAYAVFNLNKVGSPMYVIREADSFQGQDRMVAGPFNPENKAG